MGNYFGTLYKHWFGPFPARIAMLGLATGVGRTTMLYHLKLGVVVRTIPTIGFNHETITYKNIEFQIWDTGGGDKIYPLWRHYFQNCKGVIYVVDSADREMLSESIENFTIVFNSEELKGVNAKFLILANKQDLPNAMSVEEISERFQIPENRRKDCFFQATCALTLEGVHEGLDWLAQEISSARWQRTPEVKKIVPLNV